MRLVMTLLVRDAEALLAENIEFHRAQGVDFFIVTDNASVDATGAIARRYEARGLARVIDEPGDDYRQGDWVTRMARLAAREHGADWIVNNDDDEFWHAPGHDIKALLAEVPPETEGLRVHRFDHPPLAGMEDDACLDAMVYREKQSLNAIGEPLPPKLVHRACPDIKIAQGNARATRGGHKIATGKTKAIRIEHFPVRGYAAFERKIRTGGAAYARNTVLDPTVGSTWRNLYALWGEGGLRAWYDARTLNPRDVARELGSGDLVREDVVPRTLAAIRAAFPDG